MRIKSCIRNCKNVRERMFLFHWKPYHDVLQDKQLREITSLRNYIHELYTRIIYTNYIHELYTRISNIVKLVQQ